MKEKEDPKSRRARRHHRNLVAKHARDFNTAGPHVDRKKQKRDKHPATSLQEAL
tara:strand:- start:553 stop:714 length:162 start_codon:yes stop_codon:yes gene_type:complete